MNQLRTKLEKKIDEIDWLILLVRGIWLAVLRLLQKKTYAHNLPNFFVRKRKTNDHEMICNEAANWLMNFNRKVLCHWLLINKYRGKLSLIGYYILNKNEDSGWLAYRLKKDAVHWLAHRLLVKMFSISYWTMNKEQVSIHWLVDKLMHE